MLPPAGATSGPNPSLKGTWAPISGSTSRVHLAQPSIGRRPRRASSWAPSCGRRAVAPSTRAEGPGQPGSGSGRGEGLEPGRDPVKGQLVPPQLWLFEGAQPRGLASPRAGLKPQLPHPGAGGVESYFFTVRRRRRKGARTREAGGPLARNHCRSQEPGARGPGSERGGLAPPAGLHGAEGPRRGQLVGEEGPAAAGGWGEAVFRYRGGLRRGLGPPCPLLVPDQGFCVPSGAGQSLPPERLSLRSQRCCWPSPRSESWKCLEVWAGLWTGGGWGLGSGREGSHPCPACPWRPLGQFLSRWQLFLQVPVFRRPRGAGVGGPQWGTGPPVFLRLRRLLFDLHLVAATEGILWAPRGLSSAPANTSRIWGHSGVSTAHLPRIPLSLSH